MKDKMTVSQRLIVLTVGAAVVALSVTGRAEEHKKASIDASKLPHAATKQGVTYAGDIKAIFEKSCVKCHNAEKPKAKLNLTTLAGALKGGADGKVIEPGNSVQSSLFVNVTRIGDDEDLWMPPKDNKAKIPPLTTVEMGLIRAWIDQGAK